MTRRQFGFAAGLLLLIFLGLLLLPRAIVQYELHAFESRLHAGMTPKDVTAAASGLHLSQTKAGANEMAFPIAQPWGTGSACSDDYLVIVSLKNDRVASWTRIKESLCVKN